MKNFKNEKISFEIQKALDLLNYENASPVQRKVIPAIFEGKDLLVEAQTGSGKTAAFLIPLCESIVWEKHQAQVLILAPSRELSMQIAKEAELIGRFKRIKVEAIYGQSSFDRQRQALKEMTHILVATPGRLIDHIKNKSVDLSSLKAIVIDEADEMLNMGFIDQVQEILAAIPQETQKMLFSASLSEDVISLAKSFSSEAESLRIQAENPVLERIEEKYILTESEEKKEKLYQILILENPETAIIFCNTRKEADDVAMFLKTKLDEVHSLHGGLEQEKRTEIIQNFKQGKFRYLVASDLAARGIDIDDLALVINYDIPDQAKIYTHRIGRSARIDKHGKAISLVEKEEEQDFLTISNHRVKKEKLASDTVIKEKLPAFHKTQKKKPLLKDDKEALFKDEITRLHINAGKDDKLRAGDIVGSICAIEGMKAEDIGGIDILDHFSFVDILNKKADIVLKAFETENIKGKRRKVSRSQ